jgi:hypothetical protein
MTDLVTILLGLVFAAEFVWAGILCRIFVEGWRLTRRRK